MMQPKSGHAAKWKRQTVIAVSMCIIFFFVIPVMALEPSWQYSEPGVDIGGVALSSNGSSIAVAAGKIWLFSKEGTLRAKEPFGDNVVMTPDGSTIVSTYSSTLYLFRRNTGKNTTEPLKKEWDRDLQNTATSLDIADNGNAIALTTVGKGLSLYTANGTLAGYNNSYYPIVRVSADGRYIDGISQYGLLTIINNGRVVNRSYAVSITSMPKRMALSSKGDICVFNEDQRVRRIFTSNGSDIWEARATGDVTSLVMTPSGSSVIVGTDNGHIDMFNAKGNRTWTFETLPQSKNYVAVSDVAVSDNGASIAAGTSGGQVILLNSRGELQWSNQTTDHIHHIAISGDGSLTLATGEGTVYAFTTQNKDSKDSTQHAVSRTPTRGVLSDPTDIVPDDQEMSQMGPEETMTSPNPRDSQQYSVIITAQQSPLSLVGGLAALCLLIFCRMRRN